MTKRRLLRWSLLLVLLAAFAVWLEPTRVVWGWLRGEAFYQGRPTSWWREESQRWFMTDINSEKGIEEDWIRKPSAWDRLIDKFVEPGPAKYSLSSRPALLKGDPAATAVLE